jgi:hypothetical protein
VKCWFAGHVDHTLRAHELVRWLSHPGQLGPPTKYTIQQYGAKPKPGEAALAGVDGKKGLVYFMHFWGTGNQGDHIDLWDGMKGKTLALDYFTRSEQVWFWELNA